LVGHGRVAYSSRDRQTATPDRRVERSNRGSRLVCRRRTAHELTNAVSPPSDT
jgi:hypothetical protein